MRAASALKMTYRVGQASVPASMTITSLVVRQSIMTLSYTGESYCLNSAYITNMMIRGCFEDRSTGVPGAQQFILFVADKARLKHLVDRSQSDWRRSGNMIVS